MSKIQFVLATFQLLFLTSASAQQVVTDHDWYLAGEKMTVAVEVSSAEKTSKVAYVELCDTAGLQADAVIALADGRGQGCLYLPQTLHSGYYLLSIYTRMGTKALQLQVPVINVLRKSSADDIKWVEGNGSSQAVQTSSGKKQTMTPLPESYHYTLGQRPENEGHCVYARIRHTPDMTDYNHARVNATLAVVGKTPHIFQGKTLNDSTVVFNTYDVYGAHSIVLSAETQDGTPLQVDIVNPFANLRPSQLPSLTFSYNRDEIEKRSMAMQLNAMDTMAVDSTTFKDEIFSTKPVASYDLDEYRQFRTVREVFLEYINFVHRAEKGGVTRLYVSSEAEGYGEWPALVLLDGMPVRDIERLMQYDARRVHYISIYDDFYTFGNVTYKGIVNIVTRTGKLTNFPPESTSAYLIYNFPQPPLGK